MGWYEYSGRLCIVFVLIGTPLSTEAAPSCKKIGSPKTDVLCESTDTTDYVLSRGLVSDNNRTRRIILKKCRISDVDYEAFENLNALTYIDLSQNKITKLKLGVLDETKAVTHLNLSYNQLTGFPLGLFDQKPNLKVLDLKGNKIDNLELGVFDPLTKLKHLDLSSNELTGVNLNEYLLSRNTRITFMDFSRNDMTLAPDDLLSSFQELDFLNLDRCSLEEVPTFAVQRNLKTMKHLMLSTNQISKIDRPSTFSTLDNLEILNLVDNIIQEINDMAFKPLKQVIMILLRRNKLKSIPDTLFQNLPNLANIDLSHNLISLIPVNAFRGTGLRNLNLASNRFSYLQDNFVLELKNSGARLSKFFFHQNPWQCTCLMQLLKEVKKFEIEYNSSKYDGKSPVCVSTKEYVCHRHAHFNQIYEELYDEIVLGKALTNKLSASVPRGVIETLLGSNIEKKSF